MNTPDKSTCPKCGAPIPGDAPRGLCPKCVLEGAASAANTSVTRGKTAPPPPVEEIAPHFPDLEILGLLGAGGMGAVYKARQPQLDRFVALKILSHDLASDPAFAERFNREARVLARLSHPNIVGIFDFGTAGPYCYFLMEYVDGVNLRQAMQSGRFSPAESLAMVTQICSALKFAHEEGILHRDIKPENVLIDSKGRVKIADFGIAKLVGEGERPDVTLTMQGSVLGSPHYMAPEQIETPGDVDQRADIYSLGVVFYELLTGELPIGRFALPSEKAAMDARIDEIVLRTLAKERQARYQSAEEVSTQVEAVTKHPASASPKATPSQGEPGAARFSLSSAILTGSSLILGFLFFWLWIMTLSGPVGAAGLAEEASNGLILAVLHLLAASATAFLGFILGAVALGQIRRSGGQKLGLGLSVFATVAWPILLMSALSTAFIKLPMPDSGGGRPLGPVAIIFLMGIPLILAATVLVRGLRRWAGGVPGRDGERQHPGLGLPMLMAVGCFFLGPVLTEVAYRVLPPGEGRDPFAEGRRFMEKEEATSARMMAEVSPSQPVPWRLGHPEVMVPIDVQPGKQVSLRLNLQNTDGTAESFELGELTTTPEDRRALPTLQVGTFLKSDDQKGAIQALAAVRTGRHGHIIRSVEDLRGWKFDESLPEKFTFETPGRQEFTLATRSEDGAEGSTGILSLEVIVTDSNPSEDPPESR